MGQAQPLAGWCWVFSVVHAQMGPCSYIELRVWRCRTNSRTNHSDMPRTSGTYRNTWTDGFGCRHTMLAEYHHCQNLISKQWMIQQFNNIAVLLLFLTWMWIPSERRRRRHLITLISILDQLYAQRGSPLYNLVYNASLYNVEKVKSHS